ncbi:MAG: 2-C-methyl-D-erythritol 4-phosphate cytidylyltransferase [Planctomycetota bacterium]|jgi:2-C-methyl-D-erythritol 4-phosphate cytidylyltransferase
MSRPVKVAILLLAAGRGTRLGADVPKAYLRLGSAPLLVHSAARLLAAVPASDACEVLVLIQPEDRDTHLPDCLNPLRALLPKGAELKIVDGGATRQESMERGLAATAADCDLVLVHDAARALVSVECTRECLTTAARVGAALLAIPAADTLKRVHEGRVVETVDRSPIWYAQTPQIARRELFMKACEHARKTEFQVTDDASLLEHAGIEVAVVSGTAGNLKITRPDDLPLAVALLLRDPTPFPT